MRETISRNERLPHEFWPEVMNGGRWTRKRVGFRWKEQRGRNGGIVGIARKMRIVEFVGQQAVLRLLVFLNNAGNPWNPQRELEHFLPESEKNRIFCAFYPLRFRFEIPNQSYANFIDDYFRIESNLCIIRGSSVQERGIRTKRNSNFRWNSNFGCEVDGDIRVTRRESSWKWRGSLVEFRMQAVVARKIWELIKR